MDLTDGKTLFLLGLVIMAAAVLAILVGLLFFFRAKRRLNRKLEAEYGKKRH